MRTPTLTGILFFLGGPEIAAATANCLPGAANAIRSPSGEFALTLGEYDEVQQVHTLLLLRHARSPEVIYRFERSICVRWAPTGDAIAITDKFASNASVVRIVETSDPSSSYQLQPLLPKICREFIEHSSHGYVDVLNWAPSGLEARIWGDRLNMDKGFDRRVICQLNGADKRCDVIQGTRHGNPARGA